MDPISSSLFASNNYTPVNYNSAIALGKSSGPIDVWKWASGYGFGTKYSAPTTSPNIGGIQQVRFSPDGNYIAASGSSSPYVAAYPWSNSTGFGTKYSDPATTPAGPGQSLGWNTASSVLAVGHQTSPYITAYSWSSSGFGSKFGDPSSLGMTGSEGYVSGIAFKQNDVAVLLTNYQGSTTGLHSYPWANSTGFGTKWTDPTTMLSNTQDCVFSPQNTHVAIAHKTSPYLSVYAVTNNAWGSKVSDPSTLPNGWGFAVKFNPAGTAIILGSAENSPYLHGYSWNGSSFGSKYSNPTTAMTNTCYDLAFDPNGEDIAAINNGSNAHVYKFDASTGFGSKYSNPSTGNITAYTLDFAP